MPRPDTLDMAGFMKEHGSAIARGVVLVGRARGLQGLHLFEPYTSPGGERRVRGVRIGGKTEGTSKDVLPEMITDMRWSNNGKYVAMAETRPLSVFRGMV